MDWADERYVRVYTRDTPDWVALGWEAQALFVLILRKVDRAGVIDLGRNGDAGLANLLRIPPEVFERSIRVLLEDGCVTRSHTLSQLVVPNFLSAQEARQSDRQRQHETRARRRDRAKSVESHNTGHTVSPPVTDGHSVPSCTVPYLAILPGGHPPADALADGSTSPVDATAGPQEPDSPPPRENARPRAVPSTEAVELAEYLRAAIMSHTPGHRAGPKASETWAKYIDLAMRRDGRTPADLRKVIDFAHRSHDLFWRGNVLSGEKLREKFDQLWIQMQTRGRGPQLPLRAAAEVGSVARPRVCTRCGQSAGSLVESHGKLLCWGCYAPAPGKEGMQ